MNLIICNLRLSISPFCTQNVKQCKSPLKQTNTPPPPQIRNFKVAELTYELVLAFVRWTVENSNKQPACLQSAGTSMTKRLANTGSPTYHGFPTAPQGVTLGVTLILLTWCLCPHEVIMPYLQNRGLHGTEIPRKSVDSTL